MFLGIDMGTSGIKVALMDESGKIVDSASSPLTVSSPHPMWNEQDPQTWWTATNAAMAELQKRNKLQSVRGIGLSGQMHGATLLDKDNRVLRPCILWCDGRCYKECEEIQRRVPNFRDITGNLIMPGFTAGKLLWVKEHEPEVFAKVAKVLLPKDYLRFLLTGTYASDMADASGTMWLNTGKRVWSDDMLRATGLSRSHMPDLFEGTAATGGLQAAVAAKWGLPAGVPVVAGGGDNAAGAIGAGVYEAGQAMLSLGTSGVYLVATDRYHYNTEEAVHCFCHSVPSRWTLMSVMLSCAACLNWAAGLTGCASVGEFVAEAERAENFDQRPVFFLPYLSGERTPHNNPNAKGVFFGLTGGHRRPELARAVLEGVSFALADGMDAVHRCKVTPSSIALVGGGTRSPFWRQMLADVSGHSLNYCHGSELGPALGACRLAQIAVDPSKIADIVKPLQVKQTHTPNQAKHDVYQRRRAVFRALYKQLKPLMPQGGTDSSEKAASKL